MRNANLFAVAMALVSAATARAARGSQAQDATGTATTTATGARFRARTIPVQSTQATVGDTPSTTSSATPVLDRTIMMSLHHVPLDSALRTLAREANVGIVFSSDVLPKDRTVTIERKSISVRDALTYILRGTSLDAHVSSDDEITIKRAKPPAVDKGTLRGKVTDKRTKRAIESATISIDGTQIGVRAGRDGQYQLSNLPEGTYTVSARSLGYTKTSVQVTITGNQVTQQDFTLEATTNTLDEVVVTTTQSATEKRAIPVDVTTITAQQIRDKNITQIEQLFRGDVPGFFIRNSAYFNNNPFANTAGYATQSTPLVRGQNFLSNNETQPSLLKIYVDGVLVTDYTVITQINPDIIDHMEIVRGPAATTLYGSGASDGVIQIFTKHGHAGAPRLTAALSARAFDSPYRSSIVVSPSLDLTVDGGSPDLAYSVQGSASREGAWAPNYKATRRSLGGALSKSSGALTMSVSGQYVGPNSYNNPPDPWLALGLRNGVFSRAKIYTNSLAPDNEVSTLTSQLLSAQGTYLLRPNWSHTLTLGWDESNSQDSKGSPSYTTIDDTLLSLYTTESHRNTISYNTTWQHDITRLLKTSLTGGVEYVTANASSYSVGQLLNIRGSNYGDASTTYDHTRNGGYFGQAVFNLNDVLFLTTGLRLDQNPDYGNDVKSYSQPRVGLTYVLDLPADITLKTRAAYGWATRAPSGGQKNGSQGSSYVSGDYVEQTVYLANPSLKPATQSGVEGGFDLYVGNVASFTVTVADQSANNDIFQSAVSTDTSNTPVGSPAPYKIITQNQFINIGKMETRSVDLTGQVQWRNWGLSGTYSTASNIPRSLPPEGVFTSTYARLQIDHRIASNPTFTGGATLSYTTAAFTANLDATFCGRVEASDQLSAFTRTYGVPDEEGPPLPGTTVTLPRWAKYNFNWNQRITTNTTVFTRIENLFNSTAVEGLDTRSPLEGRIFTVGLRIVR